MKTLSWDEDGVNGIEWQNININLEKIEPLEIAKEIILFRSSSVQIGH